MSPSFAFSFLFEFVFELELEFDLPGIGTLISLRKGIRRIQSSSVKIIVPCAFPEIKSEEYLGRLTIPIPNPKCPPEPDRIMISK